MSERMTDSSIAYDWRLVQNKTDATEQTAMAQTRLEDELDRARRVEQEQAEDLKRKDEAIKALADALMDTLPPERRPWCWCPMSRDVGQAGHQPPCERARIALRLAERLP